MPRDATSSDALKRLLKTILNRKILSERQIISCWNSSSPKGLHNGGTNACYINAPLLFIFNTIRRIPSLKAPWERFVQTVLDDKNDIDFVRVICTVYHQLYYTMKTDVSITERRFKMRIDKEISEFKPDSVLSDPPNFGNMMCDANTFIQFFAQKFNEECKHQKTLESLRKKWIKVFGTEKLFEFLHCSPQDIGDIKDCSKEFVTTNEFDTLEPIPNYNLLQSVMYVPGHFIFFNRETTGWTLYDDSIVKQNVPMVQGMTFDELAKKSWEEVRDASNLTFATKCTLLEVRQGVLGLTEEDLEEQKEMCEHTSYRPSLNLYQRKNRKRERT